MGACIYAYQRQVTLLGPFSGCRQDAGGSKMQVLRCDNKTARKQHKHGGSLANSFVEHA